MELVTEDDGVLSMLRLLWSVDDGLRRGSRSLSRTHRVTGRQRLLLKFLDRYPRFTADGMARFLDARPKKVEAALRKLSQLGLVLVERDLADPRLQLFRLSGEGRRLVARNDAPIEKILRKTLASLPVDTVHSAQTLLLVLATAMRHARHG